MELKIVCDRNDLKTKNDPGEENAFTQKLFNEVDKQMREAESGKRLLGMSDSQTEKNSLLIYPQNVSLPEDQSFIDMVAFWVKDKYAGVDFKIGYYPKNGVSESKEEVLGIKKCAEKCKKDGIDFVVLGEENGELSFDSEAFAAANEKLNSFVDFVKGLTTLDERGKEVPLSVAEKYVLACRFVADKYYKEVADGDNTLKSRNWISVLTGDEVVCSGYSRLLDVVCKKLFDAKELDCNSLPVGVYDSSEYVAGSKSNHMVNMAVLRDPKYGIDGTCYTDLCAGSKNKETGITDFSWFMLSPKDVSKKYDEYDAKLVVPASLGFLGDGKRIFPGACDEGGLLFLNSFCNFYGMDSSCCEKLNAISVKKNFRGKDFFEWANPKKNPFKSDCKGRFLSVWDHADKSSYLTKNLSRPISLDEINLMYHEEKNLRTNGFFGVDRFAKYANLPNLFALVSKSQEGIFGFGREVWKDAALESELVTKFPLLQTYFSGSHSQMAIGKKDVDELEKQLEGYSEFLKKNRNSDMVRAGSAICEYFEARTCGLGGYGHLGCLSSAEAATNNHTGVFDELFKEEGKKINDAKQVLFSDIEKEERLKYVDFVGKRLKKARSAFVDVMNELVEKKADAVLNAKIESEKKSSYEATTISWEIFNEKTISEIKPKDYVAMKKIENSVSDKKNAVDASKLEKATLSAYVAFAKGLEKSDEKALGGLSAEDWAKAQMEKGMESIAKGDAEPKGKKKTGRIKSKIDSLRVAGFFPWELVDAHMKAKKEVEKRKKLEADRAQQNAEASTCDF